MCPFFVFNSNQILFICKLNNPNMRKLLLPFLFFCSFLSEAQTWQNITPQNGAFPITDIQSDSKGNLYVFCPSGIFTSTNQGVNWSKLGKGIFNAFNTINSKSHLSAGSHRLLLINDTIHLFVPYQEYNSNIYNSIYYDKGSNSWKTSNKSMTIDYSSSKIVRTSKLIAYINLGDSKQNYLIYTSDGMKTWNQKSISSNTKSLFVMNNKLFYFNNDTLISTIDGNLVTKNLLRQNNEIEIVNNKISDISIAKNGGVSDSVFFLELDTISFKWKTITRNLLSKPISQNYNSPIKLLKNGWLIAIGQNDPLCLNNSLLSKDFGKTWEKLIFKESVTGYYVNIPFDLINGRLYFMSPYKLMQSSSISNPTDFNYTDPTGFGSQFNYEGEFSISKNFIGSHLKIAFCNSDPLDKRQRWDGTKWNTIPNPKIPTANSVGYKNTTSNYYIWSFNKYLLYTKDEGISWDSLQYPIPKNEDFNVTEIKNIFYAVNSKKVNDTIFVTNDFGKNWIIKTIPTSILTGAAPAFSRLDFKGDTLYLIQNKDNVKKIYSSMDQGSTWDDITYNIPENLYIYQSDDYNEIIDNNNKETICALRNPNKYAYINYRLNRKSKTWDLLDSSKYYFNTSFQMDTSMRINFDKQIINYEFRYQNGNWFNINNIIDKLQKGDTILQNWNFPYLYYNNKGLYVTTNFGLFYTPYPNYVTGLQSENKEIETIKEYSIYPNPTENHIQIKTQETELDFRITDMTGRELENRKNWNTQNAIDITNLESGFYLLKVKGKNETTLKFVKR
jgi:hypothetical protein